MIAFHLFDLLIIPLRAVPPFLRSLSSKLEIFSEEEKK